MIFKIVYYNIHHANIKTMKNILYILFFTLAFSSCELNDTGEMSGNRSPDHSPERSDAHIEADQGKDYLTLGFQIMKEEHIGPLQLRKKFSEIIDTLGMPDIIEDPAEWAADNETHQTVKYIEKGIELDLIIQSDSVKTVNMITIQAPCKFKTSRGIGIGSTYETVAERYEEYIDKSMSGPKFIVCGSFYGGILISFEEHKVVSIFIGAAAE